LIFFWFFRIDCVILAGCWKLVAGGCSSAHSCNPNFQNLSKVAFSTLFLIKTTPFLIKTISKLYYFLTLFIRIFHFLRFCAVAFSRQFSAPAQPPFTYLNTQARSASDGIN
jgi:hypothetical protein